MNALSVRVVFRLLVALAIGSVLPRFCRCDDAPLAFLIGQSAFRGQLVGIDGQWNLQFTVQDSAPIRTIADLAYWGRIRDVEAGPQIVLAEGGMLQADVLLLDENQIVIGDGTGLGRGLWDESTLPREAVRGILIQPPAGVAERDKLWEQMVQSRQPEDSIWLRGGETVAGKLISAPRLGRFWSPEAKVGGETYDLMPRGGKEPLKIPASKVIAIGFGSTERDTAADGQRRVWLGMSDGSLVCATSVATQRDALMISLSGGGEAKLSGTEIWKHLVYVEPVTEHLTWLSDLKPESYQHVPFVSIERPLGADHCVIDRRFRCGGSLFRKGLGMPSGSRVIFDARGYRKFEAEIAIDDAAELDGSVVFKIELKSTPSAWRTVYESPVVRGGDTPLPISVDLTNAHRMALVVEFADHGDVCDYANWLNARLIK